MQDMQISKLVLNDGSSGQELIFSIGDKNELNILYDRSARKCFIMNNTANDANVTIDFTMRTLQNGMVYQVVALNPLATYPLDDNPVDQFGQSSIVEDVSFTSTENVWGFDYNNECLSEETYKTDSNYNRILASISIVPKISRSEKV